MIFWFREDHDRYIMKFAKEMGYKEVLGGAVRYLIIRGSYLLLVAPKERKQYSNMK